MYQKDKKTSTFHFTKLFNIPCINAWGCQHALTRVTTRSRLKALVPQSSKFLIIWTLQMLFLMCWCWWEVRNNIISFSRYIFFLQYLYIFHLLQYFFFQHLFLARSSKNFTKCCWYWWEVQDKGWPTHL